MSETLECKIWNWMLDKWNRNIQIACLWWLSGWGLMRLNEWVFEFEHIEMWKWVRDYIELVLNVWAYLQWKSDVCISTYADWKPVSIMIECFLLQDIQKIEIMTWWKRGGKKNTKQKKGKSTKRNIAHVEE